MFPKLRVALIALAVGTGCHRPDNAHQTLPGKELYRSCAPCHLDLGQGSPALQAPAIAGLPDWYVEAQLSKFRTGARGAHPDDYEGLRMRPMSRQLMSLEEVKAVTRYVSSLPSAKPMHSVKGGDAKAGQASFATCMACHGDQAQGNVSTRAPPLWNQSDWYMLAQLKKFKAGVRGSSPADASGASMRAMSAVLADEQMMKNVVAYIASLRAR